MPKGRPACVHLYTLAEGVSGLPTNTNTMTSYLANCLDQLSLLTADADGLPVVMFTTVGLCKI